MEINGHRLEDVIVTMGHPYMVADIKLSSWIEKGPSLSRPGVRPIAVRSAITGEQWPLTVIPLAYRNDSEANELIAAGRLRSPWARVNLPASPSILEILDIMVSAMIELGVSRDEAVARLTCHYRGSDLTRLESIGGFAEIRRKVAEIFQEPLPAKDSGCWPESGHA